MTARPIAVAIPVCYPYAQCRLPRIEIDPDAAKVIQRLRRSDHAAYLVGGCVRDLLLGRKPKDFDVVTSATPARHQARCSRTAGSSAAASGWRTSSSARRSSRPPPSAPTRARSRTTTATAPRPRAATCSSAATTSSARPSRTRAGATSPSTASSTTSRRSRSSTTSTACPISRRGVVRTIGDPDIRFREDPIRILRAVKFAARCDLTIEPETYRRMMEHRQEIAKCAQARVSEEFYRLLRGGRGQALDGAAGRDRAARAPGARDGPRAQGRAGRRRGGAAPRAALGLPGARSIARRAARPVPPSNALLLAVLLLPPLRDALDPDSNGVRDVGQLVGAGDRAGARAAAPVAARQRARAPDPARAPPHPPVEEPAPQDGDGPNGEFVDEALRLAEIVSDAESADPTLAGRPIIAEGTVAGEGDGRTRPPSAASSSARARAPSTAIGGRGRGRGRDRRRPDRRAGTARRRPAATRASRRPGRRDGHGAARPPLAAPRHGTSATLGAPRRRATPLPRAPPRLPAARGLRRPLEPRSTSGRRDPPRRSGSDRRRRPPRSRAGAAGTSRSAAGRARRRGVVARVGEAVVDAQLHARADDLPLRSS